MAAPEAAHVRGGPSGVPRSAAFAIRRDRRPPLRRAALLLLTLWAAVVLTVTLWPTHVDKDVAPLLLRALARLHERGLVEWLTYSRIEFGANVAMLVPLGFLAVLAIGRRRWALALLLGPMLSMSVELVQSTMPGRTASWLDVLANSSGAAIGVLLGVAVESVAKRRRRRATAGILAEVARRTAAAPEPASATATGPLRTP